MRPHVGLSKSGHNRWLSQSLSQCKTCRVLERPFSLADPGGPMGLAPLPQKKGREVEKRREQRKGKKGKPLVFQGVGSNIWLGRGVASHPDSTLLRSPWPIGPAVYGLTQPLDYEKVGNAASPPPNSDRWPCPSS